MPDFFQSNPCGPSHMMFRSYYFPISNVINRQSMSKRSAHMCLCVIACVAMPFHFLSKNEPRVQSKREKHFHSFRIPNRLARRFGNYLWLAFFAHHSLVRCKSNERMTPNNSVAAMLCGIANSSSMSINFRCVLYIYLCE